jgi:Asp/Glu/hydantoin racemase
VMRRILVVNSNTSTVATEHIRARCAARVDAATHVTYVNIEAGPQGIDSLLDRAIAGIETVRVITQHREEFDAFVVACATTLASTSRARSPTYPSWASLKPPCSWRARSERHSRC